MRYVKLAKFGQHVLVVINDNGVSQTFGRPDIRRREAATCSWISTIAGGSFRFYAAGQTTLEAVARVALADAPREVTVDEKPLPREAQMWDAETRTLLLRFPNSADGHWIEIR
jgi:hypothetical protein